MASVAPGVFIKPSRAMIFTVNLFQYQTNCNIKKAELRVSKKNYYNWKGLPGLASIILKASWRYSQKPVVFQVHYEFHDKIHPIISTPPFADFYLQILPWPLKK